MLGVIASEFQQDGPSKIKWLSRSQRNYWQFTTHDRQTYSKSIKLSTKFHGYLKISPLRSVSLGHPTLVEAFLSARKVAVAPLMAPQLVWPMTRINRLPQAPEVSAFSCAFQIKNDQKISKDRCEERLEYNLTLHWTQLTRLKAVKQICERWCAQPSRCTHHMDRGIFEE